MRSELGRIEMNKLFQSRKELNLRIRETLEETCQTWGITCDRYEILRIEPPAEVRRSMQLQAEAERVRRKDIILSEAKKFSEINIAEGRKKADILRAEGHAEALEIKAIKEKDGLQLIAHTIMNGKSRGIRALDYNLKRKYYDEYANILKNGNITILPDEEAGSSGNSSILGAVAMMMKSQNQPVYHDQQHYYHDTTTTDVDAKTKPTTKSDKKKVSKDTQQAGKYGAKADADVDWNAISFFNNSKLDQPTERKR